MCRVRRFVLPVFTLLLISSNASGLPVSYVDGGATGANDGTSWADAYNELRDALAAASDLPGVETAQLWIASPVDTLFRPFSTESIIAIAVLASQQQDAVRMISAQDKIDDRRR